MSGLDFIKDKSGRLDWGKVGVLITVIGTIIGIAVSMSIGGNGATTLEMTQTGTDNIQQINVNSTVINQHITTNEELSNEACERTLNWYEEGFADLTENLTRCLNEQPRNISHDECLASFNFPIMEKRGLPITQCDGGIYTEFSDLSDQITIDVMIIPYESPANTRYIYDLGGDLEANRASLFLENGFLKVQTKSEDYQEGLLKIPLYDLQLKAGNEYGITTRVERDMMSLFLFDYSKTGRERLIANKTIHVQNVLDLNNSALMVGADLAGNNQFDGVFDEFRLSEIPRSDDWIIATHCQTSSSGPFEKDENKE